MHITAEDVVVEIMGADGRAVPTGTPGEIVVTHLATCDFPFIRYRTGDIGVLDHAACACGRGLPKLREVQGRTTDFVVAADGTVMHGLSLIYVLRDIAGIKAFKVIQETRARTQVQLVPDAQFEQASLERIASGFKRRLGAGVDVQVSIVDAIAPEKSGKFRYIVSHAVEAAG
jgi:phenylacetate-CoA ligase